MSPLGESENDAASPPDAAFNAGMQAGLDALQKAAAGEGGAVPDLFGNLKNNELMKNLVDGNPEFRELLSDPEAMQAWLSEHEQPQSVVAASGLSATRCRRPR